MTEFGSDIPSKISISIPPDERGMTGRECPNDGCLGYFTVEFGTGLKGEGLPCHCPYCGHKNTHDHFWTSQQIAYAESVALNEIDGAVFNELKKLEFNTPPQGLFGIGFSMKLEPLVPRPIQYYREKQLETDVVCSRCTLHYSIYGVFGFCPDCGIHNSLQILQKNLELAGKELDLAAQQENQELRNHLIGDALENVVSAFDGFGRETVALCQPQDEGLSFQNIAAADTKVTRRFGTALSAGVGADQWQLAVRCFQKRHLLAHKMGVIDEKYIATTNDPTAQLGRKVRIEEQEVRTLIATMDLLGNHLMNLVQATLRPPTTPPSASD